MLKKTKKKKKTVFGRTNFAHINWSPSTMASLTRTDLIEEMIGIAVHELTHALGFGRADFEVEQKIFIFFCYFC